MSSPTPVVVAIPARDEAATIAQTVTALGAQLDLNGRPLSGYRVLVLANNCRDETAACARRAAPASLTLEVREVCLAPDQATVVGARRAALDAAAVLAGADGLIVSTDADTLPAPDWLAQLTRPLRAGAAAAAGRILLARDDARDAAGDGGRGLPGPVRRTHLLDTAYRLEAERLACLLDPDVHDPWPRHHQHFGASLALTVAAYRQVGGVPQVQALEDVALVEALRQHDLPLRHTPQARCTTSARLSGRVALGLSTQLQEWTRDPAHWQVPGGAEVMAAARARAALRLAWTGRQRSEHQGSGRPASSLGRPTLQQLSTLWLAPAHEVRAALHAPTLGRALANCQQARWQAGEWAARYPSVPVAQARAEVRACLDQLGRLD